MNAFESGARKVIPAVLVYVFDRGQVLMLHRVGENKATDIHADKYNGLGGKLEPGESPAQAAVREVCEESGIELLPSQLRPLGVLQFPNFKPKSNEDWVVWLYRADLLPGHRVPDVKHETREGRLEWINEAQLLSLPLWEGDRHFLPHVVESRPISATFWYKDKRLEKHELHLF